MNGDKNMKDLDIDALLKVAESDKIVTNSDSIMELLKSANSFMSQIEQLMNKAEKMGLKPLLVRGAGVKLGIDAETPLRLDNAVVPVSPDHEQLFSHLNTLSVDQLKTMFGGADEPANDNPTTDKD